MEIADDFCPLKEIIMSINFFAVMVIYNRNLNDSLSFSSLKNTGVEIFVCDNSTKDMKNSTFESERVHILSMGGNVGLSKAYNKAVESIDGRDGYICFFDEDTAVPENYFALMEKEIEKTGADILLPCVFDRNGYMSPCKISGVSVSAISSLEELNEDNISGINSGMAVKAEVFKAYRYDENYFLDFIDHKFLSDMKKQKRKIAAAKSVELKQSFSANDFSDIKAARRRFAVFKKDYSLFCRQAGGLKNKLIGALVIAKRFININFIGRLRSK